MARDISEESRQMYALRQADRAESDRRRQLWTHARPGYQETGTVYFIEYRLPDDDTWYGASPFYDPVSLDHGETLDLERADYIADLILKGQWGITRQNKPTDYDISAVRVGSRTSTAVIISQKFKADQT